MKFPTPLRFSSTLAATLLAFALAVAPVAQAITIQVPYDIGLVHAQTKPYNFTGRLVILDDAVTEFGSATLIRRHTALTAGHVVFDPSAGFAARGTFTRGLYEGYETQQYQVSAFNALSGYQAEVASFGNDSLEAFARDMGLILLDAAPIDEDWGNYTTNSALLTDPTTQLFVVGYPGVTFDGLTMAYIVPMAPFVELGTGTNTGSYSNSEYDAEEGMSGGPVYVVPAGTSTQVIAGETVGGMDDSTGEFNFSIIRSTNSEANKFLTDAEYTSGLISTVKIKAPATVTKGTTVTFSTVIKFATPTVSGASATTTRYPELKLKSNNAGTATTTPVISIVKTSNTTFSVTFAPTIKSGSTATFQVYYDKATPVVGKGSSFTVKIQ